MPRPYPKVYKRPDMERKDLRVPLTKKRTKEIEGALAEQAASPEGIHFGEVFFQTEWMASFDLPSAPKLFGKMRARKRQRAGVKKNIIGKYSEATQRRAK